MRHWITCLLILAIAGFATAQDPDRQTAKEIVAKAARLEASLNVKDALELYAGAQKIAKKESTTYWDAAMGRVRCLVALKRYDEARKLLNELRSLTIPAPFNIDFSSLDQKVAKASPENMEKTIMKALSKNDSNAILEFGASAKPVLFRLLEQGGSDPSRIADIIYRIGGKTLPSEVSNHMRASGDGALNLLSYLRSYIERNGDPREWEGVIRLGLRHPDVKVRREAISNLYFLSDLGGKDLLMMITDKSHKVRSRALNSVYDNAYRMKPELLKSAFRLASQDELASIRRWVLDHISLLDGIDKKLARDLIAKMLKDPNGDRVRPYAYLTYAERSKREDARRVLMEGLKDASPSVRSMCLERLSSFVTLDDLPAILPFLENPSSNTRSRARSLLSKFTARQLIAADQDEAIFGRLATQGRSDFVNTKLAIAGSKKHRGHFLRLLSSPRGSHVACALYYFIRHDDASAIPTIMSNWRRIRQNSLPYSEADQKAGVTKIRVISHANLVAFLVKHKRADDLAQMFSAMNSLSFPNYNDFGHMLVGMTEVRKNWDQNFILSSIRGSENNSWRITALRHFLSGFEESDELQTLLAEMLKSNESRKVAADKLISWKSGLDLDRLLAMYLESPYKEIGEVLRQRMTPQMANQIKSRAANETEKNLSNLVRLISDVRVDGAADLLYERLKANRILSQYLQSEILKVIANEKGESAVPILLQDLKRTDRLRTKIGALSPSKNKDVRTQLALIHEMGDEVFWKVCDQMMADDSWSPSIRADLVKLAAFSSNVMKANTLIADSLSHKEAEIRGRAIYAAAYLLLEGTIPKLRSLLRDPKVGGFANSALKRFAELGYTITVN